MAAEALAEDEFGVGDREVGVEGCAGGVLEAVIGPEGLGAVGGLDTLERFFVRVCCSKGDVMWGMPVLGEDDVVELLREGVDGGDYGVAVWDG